MRLRAARPAAAALLASVTAYPRTMTDAAAAPATSSAAAAAAREAPSQQPPWTAADADPMSKRPGLLKRTSSTDKLRAKLSRRAAADTPLPGAPPPQKPPSQKPPSARPENLDDMIPITHELLRKHYANFPDPDISPALLEHRDEIAELHAAIMARVPRTAVVAAGQNAGQNSHDVMKAILSEALPFGLDNSMYTARCACEEAADRCTRVPDLTEFAPRFLAAAAKYQSFQTRQREHVSEVIDEFLPQDFRGQLFSVARQRSERTNSQALEELMANGGSVREKYALLWEQQWKRRENLAMVGNATGIWRWLVRYLAGVPQPLLSFAKDINSPKGPTDVLRVKFGSALAELARFGIELNALCSAAAFVESTEKSAVVKKQLAKSLTLYEEEIDKFVTLLQEVIVNSPFFVSPDQIAAIRPTA